MSTCRCAPLTTQTLSSYVAGGVSEDEFSAVLVQTLNRPRPAKNLLALLTLFIPPDNPELAWFYDSVFGKTRRLPDPGDRVFARLLTGSHCPDIVIAGRCGDRWRVAAVLEVKKKMTIQCRPFTGTLEKQWNETCPDLRPHVGMWSKRGLDAVPQTDTYALLPFDLTGCTTHLDERVIDPVDDRDSVSWRLVLPRDVAAGALVGASVTQYLWQTTSLYRVAGVGHLSWAHDEWDQLVVDLCRSLVTDPQERVMLPARSLPAVQAAAASDSTAPDLSGASGQAPATPLPAELREVDEKLVVQNFHEQHSALSSWQVREPELAGWGYTCVRTSREWSWTNASKSLEPYQELPHQFQLADGPRWMRDLTVSVGVCAAHRLGWENNNPLMRHWPAAGFPALSGHLVVTTPAGPDGSLGPYEPLVRYLCVRLNELDYADFDARGHDVHGVPDPAGRPRRVVAWVTWNPVHLGLAEGCLMDLVDGTGRHDGSWCPHHVRDRLVELLVAALPTVAKYEALAGPRRWPRWAAHQ